MFRSLRQYTGMTSGCSFYDSDDEGSAVSTEESGFYNLYSYKETNDANYTPSSNSCKDRSKYVITTPQDPLVSEDNTWESRMKSSSHPTEDREKNRYRQLRRLAKKVVGRNNDKDSASKTDNAPVSGSTQTVKERRSHIIHISTKHKRKTATHSLDVAEIDIVLDHCCSSMGEVHISPVFDFPVTPKQPEVLAFLPSAPSGVFDFPMTSKQPEGLSFLPSAPSGVFDPPMTSKQPEGLPFLPSAPSATSGSLLPPINRKHKIGKKTFSDSNENLSHAVKETHDKMEEREDSGQVNSSRHPSDAKVKCRPRTILRRTSSVQDVVPDTDNLSKRTLSLSPKMCQNRRARIIECENQRRNIQVYKEIPNGSPKRCLFPAICRSNRCGVSTYQHWRM